jgi:hypothetical protein
MKPIKISKRTENLATEIRIEGSKKCDEQREELEKSFLDRIRRRKGTGILQSK